MKHSAAKIALAIVLLLGISLPVWGQASSLTGTVTDPTGAVIPGAEVKAVDVGTGATRTAKTDSTGKYFVPQLSPGTYRVEVKASGFRTSVSENVEIAVGIANTLDIHLELGAVAEEVVVEGEIVGLNTTDASLGTPLTGTEVLNLPSASLDPAGLLSLQPGVTFVPVGSDRPGGYSGIVDQDGRSGSVNGARSDQTNITLDGVDVNDVENNYAFTSALRATQASLKEFRVTTSNYNADQGRSSAAQVQLVTKSGTNDIHGMAYYTHRNEALGANDFFNEASGVEKGRLRRHVYGAALGGPIVKDRFFLFGNFERMEHAEGATLLRDIPSETFRDGVLIYECVDQAGSPACPTTSTTVMGVSGTSYTVPAGSYGLSPTEVAALDPLGWPNQAQLLSYLQQFPDPNSDGNFDNVNLLGFRFNSPLQNTFNTYIARADFNVTRDGSHTVFVRGTLQDDSIVSVLPAYPDNPPGQLLLGNSRGLALGYQAVLSPTVVNNFRYGYTRIGEKFSGIENESFANLRFIDDLNGFDQPNTTSRSRQLPTHHFRDDFSVTRGTHTINVGLDFRFSRNNRASTANSFHFFTVNPSWLTNVGRHLEPGSADCVQVAACTAVPAVSGGFSSDYRVAAGNLLGLLSQIDANYNFLRDGSVQPEGDPVVRRFGSDEYEFYAQDQWRLTRTLTFTGGVRFYVASPPWETNGNQVTPTPNLGDWFEQRRALMLSGLPSNDAPPISFALGGPANNGRNYYAWDWNNWSPRVALAWAPRSLGWLSGEGKLVIRGGYSLVYDRIGPALATTFDAGGSFGMSTGITSTFGACDEGWNPTKPDCARFTGPFDTAAAAAVSLPAAPPASFPSVPPGVEADGITLAPGAFAITQALDSSITTPYAHVFTLSVGRELPWDLNAEATYVGRRGRKLLISRDLAMPADLCDPASGVCYFEAAQQLIGLFEQGQSPTAPIAYWENLFPAWAGVFGATATDTAFFLMNAIHPDTTFFPALIDTGGFPTYMTCPDRVDRDGDGIGDCPFAFFDDQFATLNAWSSVARSEYHALQLSLRRRLVNGVSFTFNYVFSHSLDHSSTPERQGIFGAGLGGTTGTTINAWDLDQQYANSDFDIRHQMNANWYVELPFGHGKPFGSDIPGWANQVLGGWELSGIIRANSGLVAAAGNGFGTWPTNWQLTGNATCVGSGGVPDPSHSVVTGPCPATQNVHNGVDDTGADRGPNLFANPDTAFGFYRKTLPGDIGHRNNLRADSYFNLDLAIAKTFPMPWEGHRLEFRWEIFNVTNSVYFDAAFLNLSFASQGSFGNYTAVMGGPRNMQVSLRYQF